MKKQFKPAVLVKVTERGRPLTLPVRDVDTAGDVHRSWPGRGRKWKLAAEVISEAGYGRATPEEVRKAFVEAAREAGVYLDREE